MDGLIAFVINYFRGVVVMFRMIHWIRHEGYLTLIYKINQLSDKKLSLAMDSLATTIVCIGRDHEGYKDFTFLYELVEKEIRTRERNDYEARIAKWQRGALE